MKNELTLISRYALAAVGASALCCGPVALGQERAPDTNVITKNSAEPTPTPIGVGSMAATGQKPRIKKDGAAPAATAATAATGSAQLSSKDKDFMMTAAKGGMMEVHMGQMAAKQGQSADVKKLGNLMVADHTKANNQLTSLATTKGVKLDTRHKMAKMNDANFDQEWLAQMVTDHQKTIAAFEAEAKGGTDADVKSWATKTLPTLKKHLKMVQDAQGKLKKAS
jgi:putative membrane protein